MGENKALILGVCFLSWLFYWNQIVIMSCFSSNLKHKKLTERHQWETEDELFFVSS